jgi:hypothetical protein
MNVETDVRTHEVEIENVRAVGLGDLRELAAHTVVREPAGTTHQLEFAAGGIAEVSYDDLGRLVRLTAEGCGMALTAEGTLLIRSLAP